MEAIAEVSEIEQLATVRGNLTEFLRAQEPSILYFARGDVPDDDPAGSGSFYRTVEDRIAMAPASGSRLTTTMTCIESLLEMPSWSVHNSKDARPEMLLTQLEAFLAVHLEASKPDDVWKSDDAAWVYCRVRTLGSYLRLSDTARSQQFPHVAAVIARANEAWASRSSNGAFFGLQEAAHALCSDEFGSRLGKDSGDQQYPPNAYLTYWGLLTQRGLERCFGERFRAADAANLDALAADAAKAWLIDNLARQVAYHYTRSSLADPQQLLWSICGLVQFAEPGQLQNVRSSSHELLIAGLRAFFEQMHDNGDWDTGAPLFHYRNAGNAYSYIYEALGELLSIACAGEQEVEAEAAGALRRELRNHWSRLRTMLERAIELGQRIESSVTVWASGHHPHRSAESWATASVYRMLQSLRRLVGAWCSEETKQILGSRAPRHGLNELRERGDTWNTGGGSVGLYLRLAFLWPIEQQGSIGARSPADRLFANDPDQPIVRSNDQARSAILFGPPGTGKTTMVEALAGALGWSFIEITPGRFLDQGMDRVSARADQIFRQIMELDRCVVLLDEIDELIQFRGSTDDPLERFFTTTMLPRLAALWELGRVLFFVNTNDIERVDTAIRRAQRFDAALLVLPPSYEVKTAILKKDFGLERFGLTREEIDEAVASAGTPGGRSNGSAGSSARNVSPGWFALMRFDQIATFGNTFLRASGGLEDQDKWRATSEALSKVANELLRLDWLQPRKSATDQMVDSGGVAELPELLGHLLGAVRRDGRRRLVWRTTTGQFADLPTGTEDPARWASDAGHKIEPKTGELIFEPVPAGTVEAGY